MYILFTDIVMDKGLFPPMTMNFVTSRNNPYFLPSKGLQINTITMRSVRIILFLLSVSFQCIGQFNLETNLIFGGNSVDEPKDLAASSNGTILFFGARTFSSDGDVPGNVGGSDFWIMKRNIDGTPVWNNTYGGAGNDDLVSVLPHSDGGVFAFGTTRTDQGLFGELLGIAGGWLMRTNANGTLINGKIFGGTSTEIAVDAHRHVSGDITMALEAGSTNLNGQFNQGLLDVWIVKVNANLNILWTSLLGGSGTDVPVAITSDINGNTYIAATSNSNLPGQDPNKGGTDVWIIKLDPNGQLLWQKTFGGSDDDAASDILFHPDGFVYVLAHSFSSDGDFNENEGLNDLWMIKLDGGNGTNLGFRRYGGTGNDYNASMDRFGDDFLIVTASTTSDDGDLNGNKGFGDVWVFQLDLNGNILQEMNYGGSLNDFAVDIVTVDTVFHVLAGSFSTDKNVPPNTLSQQDLWYFALNTEPNLCSPLYSCLQDSTTSNQLFPPSEDVLLCVAGCTAGYGPGPDFVTGNCPDFPNATAWFYLTTDANAELLTLSVTSNEFNTPQLGLLKTVNCISFQQIQCASGAEGSVVMQFIEVEPNTTYAIAVSDVDGNIGEFELCATVIFVEFCNEADRIFANATSLGSPLNGPYKPGEEVQICYELQDWNKLDCNGFQGLVPTFGPGWDSTWFDNTGQPIQVDSLITPIVQGFWDWYALGEVRYNVSNPINGYAGGQGMPPGWYFTNTGNPPPINGPDDTTGDINSCLPTPDKWKVCFTLKVVDECESNLDCSITMKTFSDGEIGITPSLACAYDQKEIFTAQMQCCVNPNIQLIQDFSICSGDTISFQPETNLLPPVTYSWSAEPDPFISGASSGNDLFQFFQVLHTTAAIPLKVRYSIHAEGNGCQTNSEVFEVTVFPLPTSRISISGPNIVCSGSTVTLNFENTGTPPFAIGLYKDNEFFANVLSESAFLSIEVDPVFTGRFTIGTLTDAFCEGDGTGFVNVTVKPVSTNIIDTAICAGESFFVGIDEFTEAGIYSITLDNAAQNNCDSIVILILSITPSIHQTIEDTICGGDTLFVLGLPYTTTTDEIIEYTGPLGCPDFIHLILTVVDTFTIEIDQTICHGDTLDFEGVQVYLPGSYGHVEEIRPGCFEQTLLHLSVLPAIRINDLSIIGDVGSNNGAILVEITGGTPPYTYLWNSGQNTESLFSIMHGMYTLTVTDQMGCMESFTFEVPMISGMADPDIEQIAVRVWPTVTKSGEHIRVINTGSTVIQVVSSDWMTLTGSTIKAFGEMSLEPNTNTTIPIPSEFSEGLYLLRMILTDGRVMTFRIVMS